MTTKQTIKAWKNAEFAATNSPVGTTEVNTAILAQVQGGRNNVIQTGCIPTPGPTFPTGGGTDSCFPNPWPDAL
jgi:hypothetical protein